MAPARLTTPPAGAGNSDKLRHLIFTAAPIMQANNKQKEWLEDALDFWEEKGLLDEAKANELRQSITPSKSNRQQLATYFSIIAICCGALAFAAIFINDKILEQIRRYFSLSHLSIAIGCFLSGLLFLLFAQRKKLLQRPNRDLFLSAVLLLWLMALLYFCKTFLPAGPYTPFLGLGTLLLTATAFYFRSNTLWILGIAAFIGWFGIFSETHSTRGLFLGMNYPARFSLLGLLLLALYYALRQQKWMQFAGNIHFHAGIILLLAGLWGLSVFGNQSDLETWHQLRRQAAIYYGLLSGVTTIGCIIWGSKTGQKPLRDYGLAFLLLNLYTRYFELFWDALNKGIFFLILSLSFAALAWWLKRKTS